MNKDDTELEPEFNTKHRQKEFSRLMRKEDCKMTSEWEGKEQPELTETSQEEMSSGR